MKQQHPFRVPVSFCSLHASCSGYFYLRWSGKYAWSEVQGWFCVASVQWGANHAWKWGLHLVFSNFNICFKRSLKNTHLAACSLAICTLLCLPFVFLISPPRRWLHFPSLSSGLIALNRLIFHVLYLCSPFFKSLKLQTIPTSCGKEFHRQIRHYVKTPLHWCVLSLLQTNFSGWLLVLLLCKRETNVSLHSLLASPAAQS